MAERRRLEIGWCGNAHRGSNPLASALKLNKNAWGDAGVAERARLLSECTLTSTEGSNPSLPVSRKVKKKPPHYAGAFFLCYALKSERFLQSTDGKMGMLILLRTIAMTRGRNF